MYLIFHKYKPRKHKPYDLVFQKLTKLVIMYLTNNKPELGICF